MENDKIVLYSTPTCGVCKMIEAELVRKGVEYRICSDIDEMEALGIMSVPTLKVGEDILDAAKTYKWISNKEVGV